MPRSKPAPSETRDIQLNIRISDDEKKRLQKIARHWGIGETAAMRVLIKRESDRIDNASRRTT